MARTITARPGPLRGFLRCEGPHMTILHLLWFLWAASLASGDGATSHVVSDPHHAHEQFLLPHRHMTRALYDGDRERIRHALHRMLTGEPSTISLVGGSITAGMGAYERGSGLADAWASRVAAWVRQAFPRGNVQVVNAGVKAVGSPYMAVCVKAHMPVDTDLVILEMAINDPPSWDHGAGPKEPPWRHVGMHQEDRRSFERLVRKLLHLPHHPAVVLLNAYSWFQAVPEGAYYHNAEAANFEFATYYGLPMISVKAAVYHLMTADVKGFSVKNQRYATAGNSSSPSDVLYYHDQMHPAGHTGHRVLAELAIFSLMHVIRGLKHRPFLAKELHHVHAPLPAPMLHNNYESSNDTCFLGDALKSATVEAVGFRWHNEAPEGSVPKWGWTSTRAGDRITLRLSTAIVSLGAVNTSAHVTVYLALLRSYEHMGMARVACERGCTCQPSVYDGHHPQKVSLLSMHAFPASQSPDCLLSVTILPQTSSGEFKVKIGGLMVSEAPQAQDALRATAQDMYGLTLLADKQKQQQQQPP